MKIIPTYPILFLTLLTTSISAQELLQVSDLTTDGNANTYGQKLKKYNNELYFTTQYGTFRPVCFNDVSCEGRRLDTLTEFDKLDHFAFKLGEDHEVLSSLVMDNCDDFCMILPPRIPSTFM